jgi:hypothetical protein
LVVLLEQEQEVVLIQEKRNHGCEMIYCFFRQNKEDSSIEDTYRSGSNSLTGDGLFVSFIDTRIFHPRPTSYIDRRIVSSTP